MLGSSITVINTYGYIYTIADIYQYYLLSIYPTIPHIILHTLTLPILLILPLPLPHTLTTLKPPPPSPYPPPNLPQWQPSFLQVTQLTLQSQPPALTPPSTSYTLYMILYLLC